MQIREIEKKNRASSTLFILVPCILIGLIGYGIVMIIKTITK